MLRRMEVCPFALYISPQSRLSRGIIYGNDCLLQSVVNFKRLHNNCISRQNLPPKLPSIRFICFYSISAAAEAWSSIALLMRRNCARVYFLLLRFFIKKRCNFVHRHPYAANNQEHYARRYCENGDHPHANPKNCLTCTFIYHLPYAITAQAGLTAINFA